MYRFRLTAQVKYGHFKEYLELANKMNELSRERGWTEFTNWIHVVGTANELIAEADYPDLATFEKLCLWLGISPSDVLGGASSTVDQRPSQSPMATAHLKAQRQIRPELAQALGEMILRAQAMLADDSRPEDA